jgi:antitoxin MazE
VQGNIQKWGNSLGLRIPAQLGKQLNLKPGSTVEIISEGDHLVIKLKRDELDKLLAQITPENRHHEEYDDSECGQEAW